VCMGGSDLGHVVTDRKYGKTAKQFWPWLGTVLVPCIWSVRVVVVAGARAGWQVLAARGSGWAVRRLSESAVGGRVVCLAGPGASDLRGKVVGRFELLTVIDIDGRKLIHSYGGGPNEHTR
jgi:hypothetical protein